MARNLKTQLRQEKAAYAALLKDFKKDLTLRAYVDRGKGFAKLSRSVVMIGVPGDWRQGPKFWHGLHMSRAQRFARLLSRRADLPADWGAAELVAPQIDHARVGAVNGMQDADETDVIIATLRAHPPRTPNAEERARLQEMRDYVNAKRST